MTGEKRTARRGINRTPVKRRSASYDALENSEDNGRKRMSVKRERRKRSPEADDAVSSTHTHSKSSRKMSSRQPLGDMHGNRKSIKIPSLASTKHNENGGDYKNLDDRRSRSRSRSSRNKQPTETKRKTRSRSGSRDRAWGRSDKNIDLDSTGRSTASAPPSLRRISSIHTSASADPVTFGTDTSPSKNANYDNSKGVSWKSDPKASFSDWTLHILYNDKNSSKLNIDVYHLHKNVVGFGHRKSNYMLRDMMESQIQEVEDTSGKNKAGKKSSPKSPKKKKDTIITRLKLPTESQAKAVPMVLDFLYYTNETKQKMSADRSVNIYKVAEILEVDALKKAIGDFFMRNLSMNNVDEFLGAAKKVRADKLLVICADKIGQMITVNPKLSEQIPSDYMADILAISANHRDTLIANNRDMLMTFRKESESSNLAGMSSKQLVQTSTIKSCM